MEFKKIKISENIYAGNYKEGSILENSINIKMTQRMFDKNVEQIVKDSISISSFRRTFYDNDMQLVTIELEAPIINDVDNFMSLINEACSPEHKIIKDNNFNMYDYLNKITIKVNDSDEEYELDVNESLTKEIMDICGLSLMKDKSTKELIDMINIKK